MTLLVILLVLALVFGIGAVFKGLLWLLLISVVLVVAAGVFGWRTLGGPRRSSS